MSRRRQQRRVDKARRHAQLPSELDRTFAPTATGPSPRLVVREARYVQRLAYTRAQAAEALGISRSTFRRLLPYVETIEMPWGGELIPVDELERLVAEWRRAAAAPRQKLAAGRKPTVPPALVERICAERSRGRSLREIAAGLNRDCVPTAHGARQWWPSTVRAILTRGRDVRPDRQMPADDRPRAPSTQIQPCQQPSASGPAARAPRLESRHRRPGTVP